MKLDLKDWSDKTLTKDDWDFSPFAKLPKSAISRIYQWELDRELGSGKGPFAKDAANKKWLAQAAKNFNELPNAPVVSSNGSTCKLGKKGDDLGLGGNSTLHVFEIKWSSSQQDLVEAFAEWLEDNETPFNTFPTNTRGRPRQQYTLLEKVAIHRFQKVGFSGGPKFFRDNSKNAFKFGLKRINWTVAQREMNVHLKVRAKELARISKAAGKNWKKLLYS